MTVPEQFPTLPCMSGKLQKKVMLRVGHNYKSPNGDVPVTLDRLKHWASEHKRLIAAGYLPPMHYDHSDEHEMLVPITMDAFKERKSRSAQNSVGYLSEFNITDDGQAAELVYKVTEPKAEKQLRDNVVQVSPVILPSFRDGAGNEYTDLITHLDVVNYPVDYSQSKAQPAQESTAVVMAIRMGLDTEPYTHDAESGKANSANLSRVLKNLSMIELDLPEDTDVENFIERLDVALPVYIKSNPLFESDDQGDDEKSGDTFGNDNGERIVAEHEMATTMSLQKYADNQYRENQQSKLESMLKKGQMTPAEFKEQKATLGAIKLSLTDDGKPQSNSVSDFIKNREAVPAGTFWTDEQKAANVGSTDVAEHDDPIKMSLNPSDDEELSQEKLDELASYVGR